MTKKSPAQLQREIDEALARRADFEKAKATEAVIEKEMSEAQAALDVFPRGSMGLTPDAVKATPEWRAAKARADRAFARLRAFNAVFVKMFAKELRAERAERTRERERRGIAHATKRQLPPIPKVKIDSRERALIEEAAEAVYNRPGGEDLTKEEFRKEVYGFLNFPFDLRATEAFVDKLYAYFQSPRTRPFKG